MPRAPWHGWATLALVLAAAGAASAVIAPPRHSGQVQPRLVDLAPGEGIGKAMESFGGSRERRQSDEESTDHIGTLYALSGDNHNQAVVHWTGYPSEVLFILTRRLINGHSTESWLWRTTDYGQTFTNDTGLFVDPDVLIEWYYISPNNTYLIFADRTHRRLYITRDEGEHYTRSDIPFTPDTLLFQSTLAPGSTEEGLAQHVLGYDADNRLLWVSEDLGDTWTLLGGNVTRYSWRVLDSDMEDKTSVYFEVDVNGTHARLFKAMSPYNSSAAPFDPALDLFEVNTFVLSHEYILVQRNDTTGDRYSSPLLVSHNRRAFQRARFPLQKEERHYALVDASEGQVFIAVFHDFNSTNLYLSEEQGLNYSLSLEWIVSPSEAQWSDPIFDVHVVEGVVGTYIANRRVRGHFYGATVISFDKGGEWSLLRPPTVDIDQQPIICAQPECSLHLRMDSDSIIGYQSILSQDSAVGLIMAQGNIGSTLLRDRSGLRLYFSYDGGFSWIEVQRDYWEFQFAAFGSIVVIVPKWTNTQSVSWSCDEGASWNQSTFTNLTDFRVIGMRTERGEKARHVTVFGYKAGGGFHEWLVVDLDFSSVVSVVCPNTSYYPWIPTDERPGSRCLLGEVIVYERRNSDDCCYIDPEYERPTSRTPCICASEDFECDFGFERFNLNSPCTVMAGIVWPPFPPLDCPENGVYTYTSGYRKVAGDRCVPGNETFFNPITAQCPLLPPLGLFLDYQPRLVKAAINVSFSLLQTLGAKLSTKYQWNFGDGSPPTTSTGYDGAHERLHVYARPDMYTVRVNASNAAGESEVRVTVPVLDTISSITILLPPNFAAAIPTNVEVVFQANVSATFDQQYLGTIQYSWDFGDGNVVVVSTATVSHTYVVGQLRHISLTVHNDVSTSTIGLNILVLAPPGEVTINVVAGDQLAAGSPISFSISERSSSEVTSLTNYTVVFGDGNQVTQSGLGSTQSGLGSSTFSHTYNQPNSYEIRVTSVNIAGRREKSTIIHVLDILTGVVVSAPPVVVQGAPVSLSANVSTHYNTLFYTPVTYSWAFGDGAVQNGPAMFVQHAFDSPGFHNVTVEAANGAGAVSGHTAIDVEQTPAMISIRVEGGADTQVPSRPVQFQLSQTQGSKAETTYEYSFGDGHTMAFYGFSNAASVSHAYAGPGIFVVSVVASNVAGRSSNSTTVTVRDRLVTVSVQLPDAYDSATNSLPANVSLHFTTLTTSFSGTNLTGDITYNWDFGDGITYQSIPNAAFSDHTYLAAGTFNLSVTASSPIGQVSNAASFSVYIAITQLEIRSFPDSDYVAVGSQMTFTAHKLKPEETFPPDTVYRWLVILADTVHFSTATNLSYSFSSAGKHIITLEVRSEAVSNSISKEQIRTAENIISSVTIAINPTVRINYGFLANLTILQGSRVPYEGSFTAIMAYINGTGLPQNYNRTSTGAQLFLVLKEEGQLLLRVEASNHVTQRMWSETSVAVAGSASFAQLRLLFFPDHLPDLKVSETAAWRRDLADAVKDYMVKKRELLLWQLDVVVFDSQNDSIPEIAAKKGSGSEVVKEAGKHAVLRAVGSSMLLAVEVTIMPLSLEANDVGIVKSTALGVVNAANSGQVNFIIQGGNISVDKAIYSPNYLPTTVIVDPGVIESNGSKLALELGAGLGVGMLLVIAVAVLLIFVTYRYHRKYTRLSVRYSRLQQNPVHFSINQDGEMVEDEAGEEEDDNPAYHSDMKLTDTAADSATQL